MGSPEKELLALAERVHRHKGLGRLESVNAGSRLREDMGFTSLDLAELTVRIEERFGVDVFAEGVVYTWGEMCERVRRGGRAASG